MNDIIISDSVCIESDTFSVFSYFTTSELISKWWSKTSYSENCPDGKLIFYWFNGSSLESKFDKYIPGKEISFAFGKEYIEVTFEILNESKSKVSLLHTVPADSAELSNLIHIAKSWSFLLTNLRSVIEFRNDLRENEL